VASRALDGERVVVTRLSARYEDARREWNEAVAGLRASDYDAPNISKAWNVKDVLGHLLAYNALHVRHIESYLRRRKLASPRAPSYSYFNRREAARLKTVPLGELQTRFDASYRRLRDLLPALDDADLRQTFPSQWWNSTGNVTLGGILREEANHIRAHAADVKKWRDRHQR
jgi:uncharacterized damage-inducible protein DinB